jgi:hypothetical protein
MKITNAFRQASFIFKIFLSLRPKSFSEIKALKMFIFGPGVGKSLLKISIRFQDLRTIIHFCRVENALEFGSGSSTLFFLSNRDIFSKLVTFEEDAKYLPQIDFAPDSYISCVEKSATKNYKGVDGTYFPSSHSAIENSTFIYVDGPVSNYSKPLEAVEPNLDVLQAQSLDDKIIVLDCRTSTVALLLPKLMNSHYFLPCKSYLIEIANVEKNLKQFDFSLPQVQFYKPKRRLLVRSSVFLPMSLGKAKIEIYHS